MFTQRNYHYPVPDKNRELRAVLEERVKSDQSRGVASGLSTQRFPPEGPVLVISRRWPDLAACEANLKYVQSDPTQQAYQAKVASLQIKPIKQELFQTLIQLPPRTGQPGFTQRISFYPAADKGPELRAVLEERVKRAPSRGVAAGLSIQRFGPEGAIYVVSQGWPDLAAYEANLQAQQSDPTFRPFQSKVASLTRQPNKQELFQALIPLPPM